MEQLLQLARTADKDDLLQLISQAFEVPGVFVFSDFLDLPNIIQLKGGPNDNYYNTLCLFSSGMYKDYMSNQQNYIKLNETQIKKLHHLTIVSIAATQKCIPYSILHEELQLKKVRDLEDVIIETIYSGILGGKMDQKHKRLEVDYMIGRDVLPKDLDTCTKTLQTWCENCSQILNSIQEQVDFVTAEKKKRTKKMDRVYEKVREIRDCFNNVAMEIDDN